MGGTGGVFLGIDIGSTTVKVVVLDHARRLLGWRYVRSRGRPREALLGAVSDLAEVVGNERILALGLSGSGGGPIADLVGGTHVNELVAQTRAIGAFHPEARTVIEIGGQDSKLLSVRWDPSSQQMLLEDFAMNALCAAGTGAFLDQQAERLGVAIDTPSRVYHGGKPAPELTGWRRRVSQSLNARLRREQGGRVIWRKHWMVLLPRLWWSLLILGVVLFFTLAPPLTERFGAPTETIPLLHALTIAGIILTLIALAHVIWVIADWRNDTYEVSDNEIAHVNRVPLGLSEDRMSAGLGRIQNVSMSIPSPLHWLLNYGDVTCQTAAEAGAFIFYAVPDPRAVAQEILTRMDNFRRQEERDAARKRSQELPDWFEMYNRIEPEVLEERLQRNGG